MTSTPLIMNPTAATGSLACVPERLQHYIHRPETERVNDLLIAGDVIARRRDRRVGVFGQAGIGKTVLAAAVARKVRERFPGGVVWLAVRQEPNILLLLQQLARRFDRRPGAVPVGTFATTYDGKLRLRERLEHEAVLLVLDDVWDAKHAAALDVVGGRGRILVTTRNRLVLDELGVAEVPLDLLPLDEALALLASWTGCAPEDLPAAAARVAEACGRLPLALAMIGGMVCMGTVWDDVLELLADADLEEIEWGVEDYPYPTIFQAIDAGVTMLEEELRTRYLAMAVFAEDQVITETALAALWGVDPDRLHEVRFAVADLVDMSLLVRVKDGGLMLHRLQWAYLVRKFTIA